MQINIEENEYKGLISEILNRGGYLKQTEQEQGQEKSITGRTIRHDMSDGFPISQERINFENTAHFLELLLGY
jgi:hypothetical protein